MSTNEIKWENIDLQRFYSLQTVLFLGIRAVLFPTAVVKTHMQVSRSSNNTIRGAVESIYRRNGVRGFWKGFGTLGIGIIPAQLCYLTTLENVKERVNKLVSRFDTNGDMNKAKKDAISLFFGGGCASLSSQLIIVPVDVVSSRLMIQGSKASIHNYRNGLHAFQEIISHEGVPGLYRGLLPSLMLYMPFSAIWWGTYAATKNVLYSVTDTVEKSTGFSSGRDIVLQAACGGTAAITGVILTNPIDVMKSRIQTDTGKGNLRSNIKMCFKEQGWRAFFTGASVRILGSLPFSIFAGTTYELIKKLSHVPPYFE